MLKLSFTNSNSFSGKGEKDVKGEGTGGATGGGGGVKPVAIVVVNQDGVHIAPVMGGAATAVERIGEVIGKAIERRAEKT